MHRYLLGLLLFIMISPVVAQDSPLAIIDLSSQFDVMEKTTEDLRGLKTLTDVEIDFPTRTDAKRYIEQSLAKQLTDATITEMKAFYVAFDLLPEDTDLRAVFNELLGQQVAGYYDTETKHMNVIMLNEADTSESLGLLERIIYVHEYTHALQDQHFDLEAYMDKAQKSKNNDMSLAQTALVEGDASYVMNQYALAEANKDPLGALLEITTSSIAAGGLTLPPDTPDILGDELLFPYLDGEIFVRALRTQGGQETLDKAFTNPPASTEQILHPELYLRGDMPQPVAVPATPPGENWSSVANGVLGEFYLQKYLETQLTPAEAAKAAAGWGGDAYQIYRSTSGQTAFVLQLVWDDGDEQAEFQTLYNQFAMKRMGNVSQNNCYTAKDGYAGASGVICVLWDSGSRIVYAPDEDTARLLLENGSVSYRLK